MVKERTKDLHEINTQLEEKQTDLEIKQEEITTQTENLARINKELEKLTDAMEMSGKIFVVDLTPEIATLAGKFGYSYNIPTADSIVLATSVVTRFTNVLTADPHFIPAEKEGRVNIIKF